ncbi:MAG: prefoldin subunit alpha [Candidatus Pacearchaeota archaeon]
MEKKKSEEKLKKEIEDKSLKLLLLDQELRKIEEQYKMIDQSILEITNIKINLDEMKYNKEKEILANVGEGIFVKAEIKDKDKVFVNLGQGIVIETTIDEAKEILEKRIDELYFSKSLLANEAEKILNEIKILEKEINKIYKL